MGIKVEVKDGDNKTYYYRNNLKGVYGLSFHKTGKFTGIWKGCIDSKQCEALKYFCYKNHLNFNEIEKQFDRSHDYRKNFFEKNHGFFHKDNYYHCAYCGKILKKSYVKVDHVISIQKVKTSKYKMIYRWLMKKLNITNVNDARNLVASCERCNSSKGSKAGIWILRGFLGKYYIFWIVFYLIIILWIVYLWNRYGILLLK